MPRFAANLGFSPLEPVKPTTTTNPRENENKESTVSALPNSFTFQTKTAQSIDVPAAQFDWNSSGLVNPLDGMKIYGFYILFFLSVI